MNTRWAAVIAVVLCGAVHSAPVAHASEDPAYDWATAQGATYVAELSEVARGVASRGTVSGLPDRYVLVSSGYAYAGTVEDAAMLLGPAPTRGTLIGAAAVAGDGEWRIGYVIVGLNASPTTTPSTAAPTTTAPATTSTPTTVRPGSNSTPADATVVPTTEANTTTSSTPSSTTSSTTSTEASSTTTSTEAVGTDSPRIVDAATSTTVGGIADDALVAEKQVATNGITASGWLVFLGGVFAGAGVSAVRRRRLR